MILRSSPPSDSSVPTQCEIEKTCHRLQAAIFYDAKVDAPGKCRAVFGSELRGEADRVDLRTFLLVCRSEVPKRGAAQDIGN